MYFQGAPANGTSGLHAFRITIHFTGRSFPEQALSAASPAIERENPLLRSRGTIVSFPRPLSARSRQRRYAASSSAGSLSSSALRIAPPGTPRRFRSSMILLFPHSGCPSTKSREYISSSVIPDSRAYRTHSSASLSSKPLSRRRLRSIASVIGPLDRMA